MLVEAAEEADPVADPLLRVGKVDVAGGTVGGQGLDRIRAGVGHVLEEERGAAAVVEADEVTGVVRRLDALGLVRLHELDGTGHGATPTPTQVSFIEIEWIPVSPSLR